MDDDQVYLQLGNLSEIIKNIYIEKKVKEDGIPSLIINRLYLGSIGAAKNLEWLKSNGISHILCVAGGINRYYPKQFEYKVIEINDAPNEDISVYFNECSDFIDNALKNKNGKVLVHCFAGMSRSVTVVSAYLMLKQQIFAVPALKFVKNKRSVANPNAGFIVQLIKYQNVIGLTSKNQNNDNDDVKEENMNKVIVENIDNEKKENEALSQKLNSSMVKKWENGRRPSLFTALAKLRGLKNRTPSASRENSLDFDNDKKVKGIIPNGLKLLREVSDENDTPIDDKKSNNQYLSTMDAMAMDDDNIIDDGQITPLEDSVHATFGDMVKQNDL